jgi:hypothetical protein
LALDNKPRVGYSGLREEINMSTENEEVIELAICETRFLILKPNTLYRFYLGEGCSDCLSAAGYAKEDAEHEAWRQKMNADLDALGELESGI